MKRIIVLLLIPSIIFSSCGMFGKRVRGNGKISSETRDVKGYNSIDVSGSIDVYVRQDSIQSVKIETDENLLDLITIREEGGVLHIHPKKGYNPKASGSIKVFVSGSEFRRFEASGSCDIFSENQLVSNGSIDIDLSGSCDANLDVKAPRVSVDVAGSGSVTLKGETRDLSVDGAGSSTFKCIDLKSENVEVDIAGSGDAEVYASVKLDVEVAGSGTVKYRGEAAVSQSVSGSGRVTKLQ